MDGKHVVSRRHFVGIAAGGVAGTLGYLGLKRLQGAEALDAAVRRPAAGALSSLARNANSLSDYDSLAKLANNENPFGPPPSVLEAMTTAFKYANRYGYPDGDINEHIADHHKVKTSNVLLGAGSGEILEVVGLTFLQGGKKVLGVEPSYGQVYSHATSIKSSAITVPLLADYRQDIPALIATANRRRNEIGFVYLCNPNNPTGRTVTSSEVKELLDGIPSDMPVLIDEAYHHFVEDPEYATAVPYVAAGRPVIIARTFSKISALAGMRLGYAVAPAALVDKMRPYSTGTINACVKWGAVAALQDEEAMMMVKNATLQLRKATTAELTKRGFDVIPSEGNFFMVRTGRPVQEVIQDFRKRAVLVGRPFPPMLQHLRVSVGTEDEMGRFMAAWGEIFS